MPYILLTTGNLLTNRNKPTPAIESGNNKTNIGKLQEGQNGNYKIQINSVTQEQLEITFSKKVSVFGKVLLFRSYWHYDYRISDYVLFPYQMDAQPQEKTS